MKIWLDDLRPAPEGWTWAKTAAEAIAFLESGGVEVISLDHDLGACEECLDGRTPEQWLEEHQYLSMPNCEHFGTGYTVACWMEEHSAPGASPLLLRLIWSLHTANPVGRARMLVVMQRIEQNWSLHDMEER